MARGREFGERVYEIRYRHALDGLNYKHEFGRGATLLALPNGDVLIKNDAGPGWMNEQGQVFLINPGGRMARRRAANGRFLKGGGKKTRRRSRRRVHAGRPAAKTTRRRRRRAAASSESSTPRRRRRYRRNSYARNPKFSVKNMLRTVQDGLIGGAEITVGEAMARALPRMVGLPATGNLGLATQAAVGIVAAIVLPMAGVPREHAAMIAAGAFSAPIKTLAVAHQVPFIGDALNPVSTQSDVRGYLSAGYMSDGGMGRYLAPMQAAPRRVSAGGQSSTPFNA